MHHSSSQPVQPGTGRMHELKQALRTHYEALHRAWMQELYYPKNGFMGMYELHDRIVELERRAPWLKDEVR